MFDSEKETTVYYHIFLFNYKLIKKINIFLILKNNILIKIICFSYDSVN